MSSSQEPGTVPFPADPLVGREPGSPSTPSVSPVRLAGTPTVKTDKRGGGRRVSWPPRGLPQKAGSQRSVGGTGTGGGVGKE